MFTAAPAGASRRRGCLFPGLSTLNYQLSTLISVEQLWADKYAALHAAAEAEESERRAEDFLDVPRTVCGLELRALTPRDLLHLDYAQSPFIRGGEIGGEHVAQFLWQLVDPQPRGWWAERKFFRHCARLNYDDSVAAVRRYLDRTFADAPKGGGGGDSGRPIGTSFVAPLIVRLAAGIPSLTPIAIMDTPIAQLFQYRKILAAEAAAKSGGKFRDPSSSDHLLGACLDECNRLNAEEQSRAQSLESRAEPSGSRLSALRSQISPTP